MYIYIYIYIDIHIYIYIYICMYVFFICMQLRAKAFRLLSLGIRLRRLWRALKGPVRLEALAFVQFLGLRLHDVGLLEDGLV